MDDCISEASLRNLLVTVAIPMAEMGMMSKVNKVSFTEMANRAIKYPIIIRLFKAVPQ